MSLASPLAIVGGVVLAHALAVTSPGPDFAVLLRQTLRHGRATGLRTALGIALGIVVHVLFGLFALGALLQFVPGLRHGIALAGALVLLGLGWRSLRSAAPAADDARTAPSAGSAIGLGFATNVLNPKATLFFVALFSTLLAGPVPSWATLLIAAWLPLATFAWFALLATLLGHHPMAERLRRHAQRLDQAVGVLLLLLGVLVLSRELGGFP